MLNQRCSVYLEGRRYLVKGAVIDLCRTANCPCALPGRELPAAEIGKLRIGSSYLGQSARSIEVILVVRVGVGGKGLVAQRVSVVDLAAPVINGVLRDYRGRRFVSDKSFGQMRLVID